MAGPSLNAFLGIAFFVVGTLATFLMYHCWGYPYDKKTHKSSAPESLVFTHRLLGYIYLGIYVYLMIQMIPRMWNYQVELPPRTVVHLSCGMMIGAILFAKIMIVRFFKHLEGPLVPFLGTMLWLCTCLVVFLSIPLDQLSSTTGLNAGRNVLLNKCTACHDLRHVLAKNRTAKQWRSTVKRMAGLSTTLSPINEDEEWQVTAYLIAISPDLVETAKQKQKETKKAAKNKQAIQSAIAQTNAGSAKPAEDPAPSAPAVVAPQNYNAAVARSLYEQKCSLCHGLDEVENYDFADFADAEDVLTRMTAKPGFDASEKELAFLLHLLKTEFVK